MITEFKIFEKTDKYINFLIKGKDVIVKLDYNKMDRDDVDYIKTFDLSYHELIDYGIWNYIATSQRKYAIGSSYSFMKGFNVNSDEVENSINQEIICIDDKAGPFGGKPTVIEGKLYLLNSYNRETKKCKIKNDNRFIRVSADRFCKTKNNYNNDIGKYNF
jgi:hypothetical protein